MSLSMALHNNIHINVLLINLAIFVSCETCWNNANDSLCVIHATLQQAADALAPVLPMEIDCQQLKSNETWTNQKYLLQHFDEPLNVTINGCQAFSNPFTLGLQYLPHCASIRVITVQQFKAHHLPSLSCINNVTNIQMLHVQQNYLNTFNAELLQAMNAHLWHLHISSNNLQHIATETFYNLKNVQTFKLQNETNLILNANNSNMFENTSMKLLQINKLKSVNALIFKHLPLSLKNLLVSDTPIEPNGIMHLHNQEQLQHVSITNCNLTQLLLLEFNASVNYLNLSGNSLTFFEVYVLDDSIARLEILDLSYNQLTQLPLVWLSKLPHLMYIYLHGNLLHRFSLPQLLNAARRALLIDLRHNQLDELISEDASINNAQFVYLQTRLLVDNNAWRCKWLLQFAHLQPQIFDLFLYDKYISPLNINGLACNMDELQENDTTIIAATKAAAAAAAVTTTTTTAATTKSTTDANNLTSFLLNYGSAWERRNQRAEALIIVFLLPLGIACLFVLLYMWIYCQKLFHWSFYRSCRWSSCHPGRRVPADVVRQLPQTTTMANDGYEIPLGNNLKQLDVTQLQSPFKHGRLNITYEKLPCEQPFQLYEEIICDEVIVTGNDNYISTIATATTTTTTTSSNITTNATTPTITQPVYDRLSSEQSTDI